MVDEEVHLTSLHYHFRWWRSFPHCLFPTKHYYCWAAGQIERPARSPLGQSLRRSPRKRQHGGWHSSPSLVEGWLVERTTGQRGWFSTVWIITNHPKTGRWTPQQSLVGSFMGFSPGGLTHSQIRSNKYRVCPMWILGMVQRQRFLAKHGLWRTQELDYELVWQLGVQYEPIASLAGKHAPDMAVKEPRIVMLTGRNSDGSWCLRVNNVISVSSGEW